MSIKRFGVGSLLALLLVVVAPCLTSGQTRDLLAPTYDDYVRSLTRRFLVTFGSVTVEILPSSAVYTSKIFYAYSYGGNATADPVFIGLNTDVGTSVTFNAPMEQELIFLIEVVETGQRFQSGPVETIQYINPDGEEHVQVTQVPFFIPVYEIGFEDRAWDQPDRPEDPAAPKDYNDAVIKVTGVYYIDPNLP